MRKKHSRASSKTEKWYLWTHCVLVTFISYYINLYIHNFISRLTCHSCSPRKGIQRCCRTKIVDEQWLDIGRSHRPNYAGTFYWKLLIVFFWNQHTHYNKFLPNLVCTTTYFWCYCREKSGVIIDRCCFFVYFVAISTEIAISIDFIWRYEAFMGRGSKYKY